MNKRLICVLLLCLFLCGCGSKDSASTGEDPVYQPTTATEAVTEETEPDTRIHLNLLVSDEEYEFAKDCVESFETRYAETEFDIQLVAGSMSDVDKETGEPDVFLFYTNDIPELRETQKLQPLFMNSEEYREVCCPAAVSEVEQQENLLGYPAWGSGELILCYRKDVLKQENLQTLDELLEICEQNEMEIGIATDRTQGKVLYAYLAGNGYPIEKDGDTYGCKWDSDEVAAYCSTLAEYACADTEENIRKKVEDGKIAAWISTIDTCEETENKIQQEIGFAALPEKVFEDNQILPIILSDFAYYGVNPNSKNLGYSMLLAQWLTSEENQIGRCKEAVMIPVNKNAADSSELKEEYRAVASSMEHAAADSCQSLDWTCIAELEASVFSKSEETDFLQAIQQCIQKIGK